MELDEIERRLINYFVKQGKSVEPDDDLFETNMIDSMGVIELVLFVEEKLGVELDQNVMEKGNFQTIEKIAGTIRLAEK